MKTSLLKIALGFITGSSFLTAEPIANWKELNPNEEVVPIADEGTNSPIFGDGVTENSSQRAWVAGRFGTVEAPTAVTLAVGETLTMTGSVVLTGGSDNANQFRFGLFNDAGQFTLDDGNNWTGGWLHASGPTASGDIYQGRTDGPMISTAGNAVALSSTKAITGFFVGNSAEAFTFSMTITRDSETTIDIISTLIGGDGDLNEEFVIDDLETSLFTYTSLAWLFGGSSAVEQVAFSNVGYSVTSGGELPIFLAVRKNGDLAEIDYQVAEGKVFILESSADLIDWSDELDDSISGTGTFSDDLATRFENSVPTQIFYRLRERPRAIKLGSHKMQWFIFMNLKMYAIFSICILNECPEIPIKSITPAAFRQALNPSPSSKILAPEGTKDTTLAKSFSWSSAVFSAA